MEDFGDFKIIRDVLTISQINLLLEYWNSIECDIHTNVNLWDTSSTTKTKITSSNRNVEIIGIPINKLGFLTDTLLKCFSEVTSDFKLEGPHYFTYYPLGGKHTPHTDGISRFNREWVITLMLNDNFEGGELVINGKVTPKEKGMAILYNGNTLHEVKPVTSGERFVITECAGKQ